MAKKQKGKQKLGEEDKPTTKQDDVSKKPTDPQVDTRDVVQTEAPDDGLLDSQADADPTPATEEPISGWNIPAGEASPPPAPHIYFATPKLAEYPTTEADKHDGVSSYETEGSPDRQSWNINQDEGDAQKWNIPQTRSITPPAAPTLVHPVSIAEAAAAAAMKGLSSASGAVRKSAGNPGANSRDRFDPRLPTHQIAQQQQVNVPHHAAVGGKPIMASAMKRQTTTIPTAPGHWGGTPNANSWRQSKGTDNGWGQSKTVSSAWEQNDIHGGGSADAGWGGGASRGIGAGQAKGGVGWGQGSESGFNQPKGGNTHSKGAKSWEAWGKENNTRWEAASTESSEEEYGEDEEEEDYGWGKGEIGRGGGAWGQTSNEGWQKPNGHWGQGQDRNAWVPSAQHQRRGGWEDWEDETGRLPKVTFALEEPADGSRNVLSPQQRSQILNSLLNVPQNKPNHTSEVHHTANSQRNKLPSNIAQQHQLPRQNPQQLQQLQQLQQIEQFQKLQQLQTQQAQQGLNHKFLGQNPSKQKHQDHDSKKGKHPTKHPAAPVRNNHFDGWGPNEDAWGTIAEEDETEYSHDSHQFLPKQHPQPNLWGDSQADTSYTMPSKTLAHAYKGTSTTLNTGIPRNSLNEYTNIRFIESKGAALEPVQNALFGNSRLARDRIHWLFSPDKDERVASLLTWIQTMSYNLGTFGLHKFLQSRERGALIANANYQPSDHPNEPSFDWLTFDELQLSMDKTLQESVVFYDPAIQVIVFVLLPSKSGNSVAMWRRKINVPNNTRLMLQGEINLALSGLRKAEDYVVHVDEIPTSKPSSKTLQKKGASDHKPLKKEKKRKWWKFFRLEV